MGRKISFNRLASLRNEIFELGGFFCYPETGGSCLVQDPTSFHSNREMLDFLWNVRILTYEACNLHGENSGWWNYLQNLYSEWEFVRNSLALRYMPLVRSVARKYSHPNQGFEDLVQEGATGMLRALDSFEVDYGVPFEAYARPWIKKYLGKCVECHSQVVRLPETLAKKRREARRQTESANQIAFTFSNDSVEGALPDDALADMGPNPEECFSHWELTRFLNQCVGALDETSQKVLRLRYGTVGGRSLETVGKECGFSREKTRKMEKKALKELADKLKRSM